LGTDQGVVHAQLEALLVQALLGRARVAVDLRGVAGIGVAQHQLADVVQERRAEQLVAVLVLELAGEPVGGSLGRDGVEPEALRHQVPPGRALEEVEGGRARGQGLHALRREDLDRLGDARDLALLALRVAVPDAQDGDNQRHVGLDRRYDLADRGAVLPHDAQDAVARLGEGREGLESVEGGCQTTAVAFAVWRDHRLEAGGIGDGGS
jgi:hypothetical protein